MTKRQTASKLMADDLFEFLNTIYEAKKAGGIWWNALEDGVRKWNKEQNKKMNPAKTIDEFLHRKAREER